MPRTGRPPLTEAVIRERIEDYCARYRVGVTDSGFPVYPAGLRETAQHREWITLFKVFSRFRARSNTENVASADGIACPVCLKPLPKAGQAHRRCADVVAFVREIGEPGLERIRAVALLAPSAGRSPKKKV